MMERRWWMLVALSILAPAAPGLPVTGAAEPAKTQASPGSQPQGRQFERDVAQFLERYGRFLECCAADPDAIPQVKALESQATVLLEQARSGVPTELKKLRSFTVQELIGPVERVRDDLHTIRKRLEQIEEAWEKLEAQELDFFTYWTERRKLREALAAIPREFQAPERPVGPPTGMEIGATPPMGPEIGTVPPTGPEAGTVPPTGPEIGTTPPTGREIGVTPPTGKAIGTTPPTGPEIGEPRK